MIYSDYITTEHQISAYGIPQMDFVYLGNSQRYVVPENLNMTSSVDLYSYLANITNWAKQEYGLPVLAISSSYSYPEIELFVTNTCDFVEFEAYGDNQDYIGYGISTFYLSHENQDVDHLDYDYNDYNLTNYLNYYDNYYTSFDSDLNQNGLKCLFDYNNVVYGDLESEYLTIRGEDTTFYRTGFHINNYESNGFNDDNGLIFSTGNIYQSIKQVGFDSGYTNGWTNGRVDGFDSGYRAGLNSAGDYAQGGAFNFITSGFEAVASIMNIEVLPHVTLGLCFSIPLVFTLIMVLFKLVRK